jgi:hypothetical protein
MLQRRRRLRAPETGRRARDWIIPTIGALTPVALIVVNIAAFIVHHLPEFRLIITILAFVSGMMLNSWTGLSVYAWLKARRSEHPLFDKSNQDILLMSGMALIIVLSALTAWGCWSGLSSDKDLPNAPTFIIGIAAILGPILLQRFFNRATRRETRLQRPGGLPAGPPATPAPAPPAVVTGQEQSR